MPEKFGENYVNIMAADLPAGRVIGSLGMYYVQQTRFVLSSMRKNFNYRHYFRWK